MLCGKLQICVANRKQFSLRPKLGGNGILWEWHEIVLLIHKSTRLIYSTFWHRHVFLKTCRNIKDLCAADSQKAMLVVKSSPMLWSSLRLDKHINFFSFMYSIELFKFVYCVILVTFSIFTYVFVAALDKSPDCF